MKKEIVKVSHSINGKWVDLNKCWLIWYKFLHHIKLLKIRK